MGARRPPGPESLPGGNEQFGYRTVSPDELEGMFGTSAPFSDFFQQFFGGGEAAEGCQPPVVSAAAWRRRGQDVEGDAEISLEDAFAGSTLTVDLSSADGPRRVEVKIPTGHPRGCPGARDRSGKRRPGWRPPGRPLHPRAHPAAPCLHALRRRPHRTRARRRWRPPSRGAPSAVPDAAGHDRAAFDPARNAERRAAATSRAGDAPSQRGGRG